MSQTKSPWLRQHSFFCHYPPETLVIFVKMFHYAFASYILKAWYRLISFNYINIICFYHYPHEIIATWYLILHITLSPDVHPNPGPDHTNIFVGGFLSFCNWNLNTLSKDDFYRITLLPAHNTEHNYDIISLCETSLDDNVRFQISFM